MLVQFRVGVAEPAQEPGAGGAGDAVEPHLELPARQRRLRRGGHRGHHREGIRQRRRTRLGHLLQVARLEDDLAAPRGQGLAELAQQEGLAPPQGTVSSAALGNVRPSSSEEASVAPPVNVSKPTPVSASRASTSGTSRPS